MFNNFYTSTCSIKKYDIQDGEIIEINDSPEKKYDPFDYYGNGDALYRKFISIDESKDYEILRFISTYGFLGLNSYLRKDIVNDMSVKISNTFNAPEQITNSEDINYSNTASALMHYVDASQREKIDDIREEIRRMKVIFKLWDSLSFRQMDTIIKNIYDFMDFKEYREDVKQLFFDKYEINSEYNKALYFSKHCLIGPEINGQISYVRPYILSSDISDYLNPTQPFKGSWIAPDLLSAMYTMVYMDLVQGKMIRKCRNETCPEWFEIYGNDDRKIYHNPKCANTQGKRDARRSKKEASHLTVLKSDDK